MLGLATAALAYTPTGSSCYDAIPLGKDFHAEITEPGTYWYYGNTFDLPLAVYFTTSAQSPKPEVEMDFTCTPGHYSDPILSRLFGDNEESGIQIEMPHKPDLKSQSAEDGKICYEKLPLIKDHKVVGDKHKVIFNDMLIYHISPDKQFGR